MRVWEEEGVQSCYRGGGGGGGGDAQNFLIGYVSYLTLDLSLSIAFRGETMIHTILISTTACFWDASNALQSESGGVS